MKYATPVCYTYVSLRLTKLAGRDSSPWSKYVASLYWAVATLSTIGYGDVVPVTDWERTFVIFGGLVGASTYAYMVGAVSGIIAGLKVSETKHFQQMDALSHFMVRSVLRSVEQ